MSILLDYVVSVRFYAEEKQFDRAAAEISELRAQAATRPTLAKEAEQAFQREGDYRDLWALQLLEGGKIAQAKEQLAWVETAFAGNHVFPYQYYNLGGLYIRFGEPDKARISYQRFLKLEPDGPLANQARQILSQLGG